MADLAPGANVAAPAGLLRLTFSWIGAPTGGGRPTLAEIDAVGLLLAGDRVRSDGDMVFYNQTVSGCRSLVLERSAAGLCRFRLDPGALSPEVTRALFALAAQSGADGTPPARLVSAMMMVEGAEQAVTFALPPEERSETVVLMGEIYRRAGGWRVRAIGQGFAEGGLATLAERFGVVVGEAAPAPAPGAAASCRACRGKLFGAVPFCPYCGVAWPLRSGA